MEEVGRDGGAILVVEGRRTPFSVPAVGSVEDVAGPKTSPGDRHGEAEVSAVVLRIREHIEVHRDDSILSLDARAGAEPPSTPVVTVCRYTVPGRRPAATELSFDVHTTELPPAGILHLEPDATPVARVVASVPLAGTPRVARVASRTVLLVDAATTGAIVPCAAVSIVAGALRTRAAAPAVVPIIVRAGVAVVTRPSLLVAGDAAIVLAHLA